MATVPLGESATKTAAQKRLGRLFARFQWALSQSCAVQIAVPPQLWAICGNGWPYALIKSTRGAKDPDFPGVTWDIWMFELGVKYARSSVNPTVFVNVMSLAQDAKANASDNPATGL